MKVFVALLIASALLVENVYPLPLALMNPLGLGLFNPLLGMGLGWGLGFGRVGFRRFGLRGRREVEQAAIDAQSEMANKTICSYDGSATLLQCASVSSSFDCQVEERLPGLENVNIRLADLEILPAQPEQFDVLKVLSRASSGLFTFIQPGTTKQVTLSIFNSEKVTQPGLWVKDAACWEQFTKVIRKSKTEDVGFALAL